MGVRVSFNVFCLKTAQMANYYKKGNHDYEQKWKRRQGKTDECEP